MIDLHQLSLQYYDINIANMPDFYLAKAQDALDAWKTLTIDKDLLEDLVKLDYEEFKAKVGVDPRVKAVRECIFRLVSYCDKNASEKDLYNEYPDKRTMAKAGIRQNAWIRQWLVYKKDPTTIKESIQNVIDYLEHPEINFPIVSEYHKEQLSRNLLNVPYDKASFSASLLAAFDELEVNCANSKNKTMLYAKMFYSFQNLWKDKIDIKGLVARDCEDWKDAFETEISASPQGYGIMWRHNLPTNKDVVFKALRKRIENGDSFDFYIVEKNWATYKAVVEDYVQADDYKDISDEWKEKQPVWFQDNFSDYNSKNADGIITQQAKVAYLVKSFHKIPDSEQLNIDTNFKLLNNPVRAYYVAYTDIIKNTDIKMNDTISEIASLLMLKKNIILQGAPGTGKTYTTAAVALKVLGVEGINYSDHISVMEKYDKLVEAGRIAFTTFHQSMDYEDFVEGYKPKKEGGDIQFELRPGVFKTICNKAKDAPCVLIIDEINRGNVSKIFGELITLLEADKREGGAHRIQVKLTYSQDSFSVPGNLYIIGTMNTTDRSVGSIDYALRRRFAFKTLKYDIGVVEGQDVDDVVKTKAVALLRKVESFLNAHPSDMKMEDLMPGHSYFMAKTVEELDSKVRYELIPLVEEYAKDGIIEVSNDKLKTAFEEWKQMIQ